jgi:hypothetical protein
MKWVKIKSWHAVKSYSRAAWVETHCGRWASHSPEVVEELPAEKSCETCLRIVARIQDQS